MKRLLALLAGGLGLGALLRRRGRPATSPSPAEDLRAKLAASRELEADREENEANETPVDTVEDVPVRDVDVAARRANVHERARRALDELQE